MQLKLDIDDRRLLLQGIWKELNHYQGIIDQHQANDIALEHANNMIKRLWALEDKLLGL